ncbi:hypothetical protein CH35J_001867 [Colletotrichum higginsianum]|uniref:Secreted protein n=1 Tax=Colletotrichum higginsianum TaxID=80884 RepID=A0A4T0WCH2_9PEZI|nr:hypothetical protein CH35J_001867 [Colletotrichum higginsianum]
MLFKVFTSAVLASLAFQPAGAVPAPQENSVINLAAVVKADHPEAYAAFLKAPKITLDGAVWKRQAVPGDGNPDPDRPPVTPDNIFLLQCSDAGFLGECLSFGAPPGRCVSYASFNRNQTFIDKYDNQTTSLSSNTGGLCQFYKFTGCNNKGDDRGVSLGYNFNLAEANDEGYSGDYDNQISSWRC